ncbi:kinase-like domain-containing protein [Phaeosphaeria sp. MPI-PUGE-AT-0046c]|nr:kinase-like domain-containing protein [Phaeosphaeria sp. MPI-PUGE-AT-0046c]
MTLLQMLMSAGKRSWRGSDYRDELFAYTNGRFLVNEAHACNRRFVQFNVDHLCSVAASVGGPLSPIQAIEKLEGGFSKALLMRKEDGREIIVKIPFPIAGPPKYTTASEVAVLHYLQKHTSIPVPRVLAWSSDSSNPVGAEYIVMEKAAGVQLFNTWGTMSDSDRFELVQQITELEGELASIRFPANGSLYLREQLANDESQVELSHEADPAQKFCIGPSCERQWSSQSEKGTTFISPEFDRGPWLNISSLGEALVNREIARIKEGNSSMMSDRLTISTEEQLAVLNMALEVMSRLDTGTIIDKFSRPVLSHTDLHMGNIFVSSKDPTKVVSLIDWQSISVSPLLVQARFPEFLSVDLDFVLDAAMPELPEDYETFDAVDKQIAEFKTRQAKMAKAYEVASSVHNLQAYKALFMPSFLQDLFTRCGEASEEGITPLRACLIQISEAWDDVGFEDQCPFNFKEEDIQKHKQQFQEYRDYHRIQEIARKFLDTDSEGWISPQLDFTLKAQQNKDFLEEAMRRSSEYNKSSEEVRRIWPF